MTPAKKGALIQRAKAAAAKSGARLTSDSTILLQLPTQAAGNSEDGQGPGQPDGVPLVQLPYGHSMTGLVPKDPIIQSQPRRDEDTSTSSSDSQFKSADGPGDGDGHTSSSSSSPSNNHGSVGQGGADVPPAEGDLPLLPDLDGLDEAALKELLLRREVFQREQQSLLLATRERELNLQDVVQIQQGRLSRLHDQEAVHDSNEEKADARIEELRDELSRLKRQYRANVNEQRENSSGGSAPVPGFLGRHTESGHADVVGSPAYQVPDLSAAKRAGITELVESTLKKHGFALTDWTELHENWEKGNPSCADGTQYPYRKSAQPYLTQDGGRLQISNDFLSDLFHMVGDPKTKVPEARLLMKGMTEFDSGELNALSHAGFPELYSACVSAYTSANRQIIRDMLQGNYARSGLLTAAYDRGHTTYAMFHSEFCIPTIDLYLDYKEGCRPGTPEGGEHGILDASSENYIACLRDALTYLFKHIAASALTLMNQLCRKGMREATIAHQKAGVVVKILRALEEQSDYTISELSQHGLATFQGAFTAVPDDMRFSLLMLALMYSASSDNTIDRVKLLDTRTERLTTVVWQEQAMEEFLRLIEHLTDLRMEYERLDALQNFREACKAVRTHMHFFNSHGSVQQSAPMLVQCQILTGDGSLSADEFYQKLTAVRDRQLKAQLAHDNQTQLRPIHRGPLGRNFISHLAGPPSSSGTVGSGVRLSRPYQRTQLQDLGQRVQRSTPGATRQSRSAQRADPRPTPASRASAAPARSSSRGRSRSPARASMNAVERTQSRERSSTTSRMCCAPTTCEFVGLFNQVQQKLACTHAHAERTYKGSLEDLKAFNCRRGWPTGPQNYAARAAREERLRPNSTNSNAVGAVRQAAPAPPISQV